VSKSRDIILACLYGFGAAVALAAALFYAAWPPATVTVLLAAVALVVERRQITVSGRLRVSATYLPIVLALVIGGPLAGVIVSVVGVLAHFERPYVRWFVWTCTSMVAASIAGIAGWSVQAKPHTLSELFTVAVVAGGVDVLLSLALATLTVALRRGPWRQTFVAGWGLILWASFVYVPMVAGLAYAYSRASVWALLTVFPPLVAAQQSLVLYYQQKQTAERLAQAVEEAEATNRQLESANEELGSKNRELEEVNLSFAASLIVSLDARDHYTAGHSAAVAVYSRDIASRFGLHPDDQQRAYLAGLMHDIGKVGLPAGILEKAAPLSSEEEALMQQHVLIGERILAPVRQFGDLAPAVRHHHERYDGHGYPNGLASDDIPLLARVIAVADTYNAMTSDRPYRPALPPNVAMDQLVRLAGTQLDPELAPILVGLLQEADAGYRVARRAEFFIDFGRLGADVPFIAAFTRS
jgi:HD-GYP domain-containing protein (c-di-GMP phosphodiesterase class II)